MDECVDGVCSLKISDVNYLEKNLMGGFEEELIHTAIKMC